ncbi:MAG: hypothetical protein MMC23_003364 [Stictis urceolatum]|nr:hypothetical protein [Stictis urceolata]
MDGPGDLQMQVHSGFSRRISLRLMPPVFSGLLNCLCILASKKQESRLTSRLAQTCQPPFQVMSHESSPLELVKAQWARKKPDSPIYAFLLNDIEVVSAEHGSIKARLKLTPTHVNSKGSVHGTVSACLIDWAAGMAIASTGSDKTGVSTDIHISYCSTAKVGDTLEVDCKGSKFGSTLAYTNVEVRRLSDNVMVCTGLHTKYVK